MGSSTTKPKDLSGPCALSFSGCGFLGIYQLGASQCLLKHAKKLMARVTRFAGASAGSLVAAVLAIKPSLLQETVDTLHLLADEVNSLPLGALTPGFSIIERLGKISDTLLPPDAHKSANGKLYISVTRVDDKSSHFFSSFDTRESLVKTLLASCYIPLFAGATQSPPKLNDQKVHYYFGMTYMDGGFTNNLPHFDDLPTLTISPFSSNADICPSEITLFDWKMSLGRQHMKVSWYNAVRGAHTLFPPKKVALEDYYMLGYADAMRYLLEHKLFEPELGTEV